VAPHRYPPAALLLSVALLIPLAHQAASASPPSSDPSAAGEIVAESTVTLVTGDRVTLGAADSTGAPAVRIDPGVEGTAFSVRRDAGQVSVIPSTVAKLVPDVFDPALFDVTGLVAMGYDDGHRSDLPVITQGVGVTLRSGRALKSVGASAGSIGKDASLTTWLATRRTTTGKVWLDRRLGATSLSAATAAGHRPGGGPDLGQVLAADGFGQESWVSAGMEWAAAEGADPVWRQVKAEVVNAADTTTDAAGGRIEQTVLNAVPTH
jgi:hypothetical protein